MTAWVYDAAGDYLFRSLITVYMDGVPRLRIPSRGVAVHVGPLADDLRFDVFMRLLTDQPWREVGR